MSQTATNAALNYAWKAKCCRLAISESNLRINATIIAIYRKFTRITLIILRSLLLIRTKHKIFIGCSKQSLIQN